MERNLSDTGEPSACPDHLRGTVQSLSGCRTAGSSIWIAMAFVAGSA